MENVTGLSNYIIDDDGKVDKDAKLTVKNLKKDSGETKEQTNNLPMIIGGVVMVVLIAVAGGIYYVKKVKK